MAEESAVEEKISKVITLMDAVGRIGIPGVLCGALFYEIHTFFSGGAANQTAILKNQELILKLLEMCWKR
jgi:hypothetical protein